MILIYSIIFELIISFIILLFSTASTHEVKDGQISCYVPLNPLDISSEWTCTICKHTVNPARIRELEDIAQKIVFSGRYL